MSREHPPIVEIGALIDALYVDCYANHRKVAAIVQVSPDSCHVRQSFDDGKGHSQAFWSETIPLDRALFEEAKEKGFVTGVLKPGYVSNEEFALTTIHTLRMKAFEIMSEWQKKKETKRYAEDLRRIPSAFQGTCFDHALEEYQASSGAVARLELSFAEEWARRGGKRPIKEFLELPEHEMAIVSNAVATVIQWLGTDEGTAFIRAVYENAGGEATLVLPKQ